MSLSSAAHTHLLKAGNHLTLLKGSDMRKEPRAGTREFWVSGLCFNVDLLCDFGPVSPVSAAVLCGWWHEILIEVPSHLDVL